MAEAFFDPSYGHKAYCLSTIVGILLRETPHFPVPKDFRFAITQLPGSTKAGDLFYGDDYGLTFTPQGMWILERELHRVVSEVPSLEFRRDLTLRLRDQLQPAATQMNLFSSPNGTQLLMIAYFGMMQSLSSNIHAIFMNDYMRTISLYDSWLNDHVKINISNLGALLSNPGSYPIGASWNPLDKTLSGIHPFPEEIGRHLDVEMDFDWKKASKNTLELFYKELSLLGQEWATAAQRMVEITAPDRANIQHSFVERFDLSLKDLVGELNKSRAEYSKGFDSYLSRKTKVSLETTLNDFVAKSYAFMVLEHLFQKRLDLANMVIAKDPNFAIEEFKFNRASKINQYINAALAEMQKSGELFKLDTTKWDLNPSKVLLEDAANTTFDGWCANTTSKLDKDFVKARLLADWLIDYWTNYRPKQDRSMCLMKIFEYVLIDKAALKHERPKFPVDLDGDIDASTRNLLRGRRPCFKPSSGTTTSEGPFRAVGYPLPTTIPLNLKSVLIDPAYEQVRDTFLFADLTHGLSELCNWGGYYVRMFLPNFSIESNFTSASRQRVLQASIVPSEELFITEGRGGVIGAAWRRANLLTEIPSDQVPIESNAEANREHICRQSQTYSLFPLDAVEKLNREFMQSSFDDNFWPCNLEAHLARVLGLLIIPEVQAASTNPMEQLALMEFTALGKDIDTIESQAEIREALRKHEEFNKPFEASVRKNIPSWYSLSVP